MARLFQYATSSDPSVIEAIEQREVIKREFFKAASAWAEERGNRELVWSRWSGALHAIALPIKPEGHGQWKAVRSGFAPYKNNVAETEAMESLARNLPAVPGLPAMLRSQRNADWQSYVMNPAPFVVEGAAWVGLGHQPHEDMDTGAGFGDQWSETLASRFHAAVEATR